MTYEFHYKTDNGLYTVVSYGSEDHVTTILPLGEREDGYEIVFEIMVSDSLSAATNIELKIKVRTRACRRGEVASWLVSSIPDREVWVRALAGECCDTLLSHSASLHPGVLRGIVEFNALLLSLRWTSIPSSKSRNTVASWLKTEIGAGLVGHLAHMRDFTLQELVGVRYDDGFD